MRADVAALPQGEAISVTAVWVAGGNISCLDDDELDEIEIESTHDRNQPFRAASWAPTSRSRRRSLRSRKPARGKAMVARAGSWCSQNSALWEGVAGHGGRATPVRR